MKKILPVFLLFASFYLNAQWVQQFDSRAIRNVHFLNDQTGWASGRGLFLRTTDGGNNWQKMLDQSVGEIIDVAFTDQQNGWLIGQLEHDETKRILLRTHNGGTYWERISEVDFSPYNVIFFLNDQQGWTAGDGGRIRYTEDGGLTWTAQASSTLADLSDIAFYDQQTGWAVGENEQILKTENGGLSWSKIFSGFNTSYHYTKIHLLGNDDLWIGGFVGTLIRTTNGGDTWADYSVMTSKPVDAMNFLDGLAGWISYGGDVWKTENGGDSWTQISTHGASQIYLSDVTNGCITTQFGTMCTDDGGTTWYNKDAGIGDDQFVHYFNDHEMLAISSAFGLIATTTNGGDDWTRAMSSLKLNFQAIGFKNELEGVLLGIASGIVDGQSVISKTEDGGKTFSALHESTHLFHDMALAGENKIFVVGEVDPSFFGTGRGIVLSSNNGGQDWNTLATDLEYEVNEISCPNAHTCFFIGNRSPVIGDEYSVFGLIGNWGITTKQQFDNQLTYHLQMIDGGAGYMVRKNLDNDVFELISTTDWGNSWAVRQLPDNTIAPSSMFFLNWQTGWLSQDTNLYKTTDGGINWQLEHAFSDSPPSDLYVSNAHHAWIASNKGIFFKDNINTVAPPTNNSDMISPIYPNPTSNIFYIEIKLPNTRLEIYNAAGQQLETHSFHSTGIKEINTDQYPKGIYLLKINKGNETYLQQLVIK